MNKTAIVVGATGMVGNELLHQILENANYSSVTALVRKPLLWKHEKLKIEIVDFENENTFSNFLKGDDLFICTGTTIKKAKSKTAFRKIDFDLPLKVATIAANNRMKKLMLISALGANADSVIFYSKTKGELENEISKLYFETICIFQPSMLLGKRSESRPMEVVAQTIFNTLGFLFVGRLMNYKGIQAEQLAKAMIHFANKNVSGVMKLKGKDLFELK